MLSNNPKDNLIMLGVMTGILAIVGVVHLIHKFRSCMFKHLAAVIFTFYNFICLEVGRLEELAEGHTTMIYIAMGNLLYNFLYYDHCLWQYKPDLLVNHIIADMNNNSSNYNADIIPCYLSERCC